MKKSKYPDEPSINKPSDDMELDEEVIAPGSQNPTDEELKKIDEEDVVSKVATISEEDIEDEIQNESSDLEDLLRLYMEEMKQYPLLTQEEEHECALKVKAGSEWAREKMIVSNLRLVIYVAKHFRDRGLPFLDLIQEGNIGLIKAVEKYDVDKGYRFATYATWWIKQGIQRAIVDKSRNIRIPVHLQTKYSKIIKAERALEQELGRTPTDEELAYETNCDIDQIHKIRVALRDTTSLNEMVGEEEDRELQDQLEDTMFKTPHAQLVEKDTFEQMMKVIETLPPRTSKIIQLRYGFVDGQSRTLEAIGQEFGLTRERVRQVEASALNKIKKAMPDEVLNLKR